MRIAAIAAFGSLLVLPGAALGDDGRYQLEKSGDGYVRLDTETGEMSICTEKNGQLVCRLAADERAAFQDEIDRIDKTLTELTSRLTLVEARGPAPRDELPSDEEFDRTLGFMERFMRRFMGIIKEFESAPDDNPAQPDKT